MKVLYVTGMYPTPEYPQKGIFCHEQVKSLKKNGVDVTVIVPITVYDKQKEKVWEYQGITINYVKYFKLPGSIDIHNIGKYLFKVLDRSFDLSSYDIYHADAPLPSGEALRLASKKYSKPYVVHVHGLDVFQNESYSKKINCNKIFQKNLVCYSESNAIIGVSKKTLEKVNKYLPKKKEETWVVYNGVDTSAFYPVAHENKRIEIFSAGNLIWLKGHDYSIQAMKVLNDIFPDEYHLTIAGRGPMEDYLKTMVKDFHLESCVDFVGYISYDNLNRKMRNSDAFLLPSYYEALGCVYLEAMSCAIPTIGCYENGIDEIIVNNYNGFLVTPKNVDDIVTVLSKLRDAEFRCRVGEKARKTVLSSYKWIDSAERLIDIYKRIIN